jgi:serine-type D-Ala-D-Ala carboxypeptidase/endopeptidase (penicillin-binding protein 4)
MLQHLIPLLFLLGVQFGLRAEVPSASATVAPNSDSPALCEADLPAAIAAIIHRPKFARSRWGILVQPLNSERPLYALNEGAYFLPASNVKLLTTAAALHHLGANYRLRTPIYTEGELPLLKTLLVVGRGDPSLQTAHLQRLVEQLESQGVRQIEQLIVDDRYFQQPNRHPTWEWEDLYFAYAPSVNSLMLNQNQFELSLSGQQVGDPVKLGLQDEIAARQWQVDNLAVTTPPGTSSGITVTGIFSQPLLQIRGFLAVDREPIVWNMAILDPAQYFLQTLRFLLETEGIEVKQARVATTDLKRQNLTEFTVIESPPLEVLIQETNQSSNNLYAEALLHTIGATTGSQETFDAGLNVIKRTLTELEVDPESYVLADGSGLSRHNLLSPAALVQTLRQMARSPDAKAYFNSLAIAGVSGTLRQRFQNTPVQGNLRGKTGTMKSVSALSGYLDVDNAQSLAFSIILNETTQPISEQREAIDRIVLVLSHLKSCPGIDRGR